MAVDTAEKRFSMMNFGGLPGTLKLMFEPDGSVDADDRAHMLDLYAGIALDAPTPTTMLKSTLRGVRRGVSRGVA